MRMRPAGGCACSRRQAGRPAHVGLTYVMEISFRSGNADRAAQIANSVADAYIVEQLEAKYVAARRAGGWLQDRLRELREQAGSAERAVVEYKNQNDIVDAGGRLMNEQQLAEVNSQLTQARSQTSEAQAKLDRIQSVLAGTTTSESLAATVTDTLKNDVITKLRSKYLDLSRRRRPTGRSATAPTTSPRSTCAIRCAKSRIRSATSCSASARILQERIRDREAAARRACSASSTRPSRPRRRRTRPR